MVMSDRVLVGWTKCVPLCAPGVFLQLMCNIDGNPSLHYQGMECSVVMYLSPENVKALRGAIDEWQEAMADRAAACGRSIGGDTTDG